MVLFTRAFKRLNKPNLRAEVFEYDNRFAAFGSDFHFFDYKAPLEVTTDHIKTTSFEASLVENLYKLPFQRWTAACENSLTWSLPTLLSSVMSASPRLQSQSGTRYQVAGHLEYMGPSKGTWLRSPTAWSSARGR